jgi:DNA helicase-2/ATP-dependent DNA helicase PcrA
MLDLSGLNPQQRDAVTSIRGPLMILAGAGTGKTRVITVRIGHMLEKGIDPKSIVALSFTNKAAREMAERARGIAGPRAKDVWLGTFHSFCLMLLRTHHTAAGLPARFGLAGTADQLDLVRRALDEKGWGNLYNAEDLHREIGNAKNALLTPEEVRGPKGRAGGFSDPVIVAEIYGLYERQLRLNRVIDFDDCIFRTVKMLQQDEAVRRAARSKYRYLMVDEYQDTNEAQLAVLEALASDEHDVCVVGDDDQSIYSWRGAMYEVIQRFEELFPKARLVKLEQNYRCSNVILDAANAVIKNNPIRKDKTLWSASKETAPIQLVPCEDDAQEARLVVDKCLSLLGSGHEPRDIGILYRANALAKGLEMQLREARIAYKTFGGQSFFERKEVKDFVCYLRLVLDCDDRLALWRIINSPQRGIGLKTLEKIEEAAVAQHRSPFEVVTSWSGEAVQGFAALIRSLAAKPRKTPEDYEALGNAIVKETGLENDIKQRTESPSAREFKLANLRSLPKWLSSIADELAKEHGIIEEQTILDMLSLDNDRRSERDTGGNHVSLMTIHAAKGLEFPAVFVVGCEEELLPHKNSVGDVRGVAEERRLFYVALTRAKKKLVLTHCMERQGGYQGRKSVSPSRFLKELPPHTLQKDDEATEQTFKTREDARKSKTLGALAGLRASLQRS